jgi:MerR family mercuric resistance operon transcriptional regulator
MSVLEYGVKRVPVPTDSLTIGTLAKAAQVNVETIRYYQRQGLMPEPNRPAGGIRRYAGSDLSRVSFIKAAQRLGFSLDDIAELLTLDDGSSCAKARTKAQEKLINVRAKLADLQRIEHVLTTLIGQCDKSKGKVRCPLIAALQEPAIGLIGHSPSFVRPRSVPSRIRSAR